MVLAEAGEHFNSATGGAVAELREQVLSQELPTGNGVLSDDGDWMVTARIRFFLEDLFHRYFI